MRNCAAGFILLLFGITCFAQEDPKDSLIYFDELVFLSPAEEDNFRKLLYGDRSILFEAFITSKEGNKEYVSSTKRNFVRQVEELNSIKRGKRNDKYLNKVYDELHLRFLKRYDELVSFERIFVDGWYNCVTACALYGLAFDLMGIKYAIKETPTHVYLVAYPDQDQIVIETTDPVGGIRSINDSFKRSFITLLQQQKLIDSQEMSMGVDPLFDKYYYSANEIDLKQLVGIHYYNIGIEFIQEKDYENALINFEKAHLLYNSEQINNMLFASLTLTLSEKDYENPDDAIYLGMLNRFREFEISDDDIESEFGRMTQKLLFEENDTVLYDSAYHMLDKEFSAKDSMIREEISFIYHYERARVLYNRAHYRKALPFAKVAYELKPESIDSETILISCFTNTHIDASSIEALEELNLLLDSYPTLKNNNRLGGMWLNLHLQNMYVSFVDRKSNAGFEYKSTFERLSEEFPDFRFDQRMAGSAYAQLVAHYFRRGQMTLARKALNQGFKYAPNNPELKTREYALNR